MSLPDPHPPPGWVYCWGCGRTFVHLDGCPDCATTAYLEEVRRYS